MDPEIGSSYGPYVVEAVIARGGQGLVLKTRHAQRGVPAALKILLDTRDLARGRFLREIETLRLLADHPGLPTPYDLGEHEGTLFIALELVDGRSLQDIVKSGGPLPEDEALALVAKTARIVAQCHEQGVLHRDLKPANVVLRESGAPCVVDFGVARVEGTGVSETSRLSLTGDLIGTPAFMAPEQVSGEGVGFQTDVYGLGSILYYVLSGRQPVSGTTSLNVITRLARDATPDVRGANPAVSAATAELLLRAMAKEPAERIQSADTFAEELEALTNSEREADSGRRLPLGLAVALAFALLGVAVAFAMTREADPPPGSPSSSPASGGGSSTPRPSRAALTALAPGKALWEVTFKDSAVLSQTPLGPWALVETAPILGGKPKHKLLQTCFLSLADGGRSQSVPQAELWCWDAKSQAAIGHVDGKLFRLSPEDLTPKVMVEEAGALCSLSASGGQIYTSGPDLFQVRGAQGQVLREVPIPGHSEVPPLALDLDPDKPGSDHLLVVTTGSAALLLTLDGRVRSRTDLPGPVSTLPVVLRSESESAEIGLVSGAGILTRLEARARNLRLLGSWDLGGAKQDHRFEPRGPLLVDHDPQGGVRQVFLHLLSGLACLSPDLTSLRWVTRHPVSASSYALAGYATSDLDRDGERELLATFVHTTPKSRPPQLTHVLFGAGGRAIWTSGLHFSPRSPAGLPDGSLLLTSATGTLVRWGPWTGLPKPDLTLQAKAPWPGRQLERAAGLKIPGGSNAPVPLRKATDLPPFTARFAVQPEAEGFKVRTTASPDVQSVWFRGGYQEKGGHLLCTIASIDVNFIFGGQRPPGRAWLEIDVQTQPRFGPAFVEFAFEVNDQPQVRTVQAFHRRGVVRVALSNLNDEGISEVSTHITPRSRTEVQVNSIRLVFREEP